MKVSEEGKDFIKTLEGFRADAYPDPGSKDGKPFTIGYGHTGPDVKEGLKVTHAEASKLLGKDLISCELALEKYVKLPLVQKEFDALACFIFNVGVQAFKDSTILRLLNLGKRMEASEEFKKWVKNGSKMMPGLLKRRTAEQRLFQGFTYHEALKAGDRAYEIYRQGLQNPRA